nr:hypothetical protein [Ningiella sp. W23]
MKKHSPLFVGLLFSGYTQAQVPLFEVQYINESQSVATQTSNQLQFGQPLLSSQIAQIPFFYLLKVTILNL